MIDVQLENNGGKIQFSGILFETIVNINYDKHGLHVFVPPEDIYLTHATGVYYFRYISQINNGNTSINYETSSDSSFYIL